MTDKHEATPYTDKPDEVDALFKKLTGELLNYTEDPTLISIHEEARFCEAKLRAPGMDDEDTRKQLVSQLDKKWKYMGYPISFTGKAWTVEGSEGKIVQSEFNGEDAISNGFLFFDVLSDDLHTTIPTVGHCFLLERAESKERIPAFVALGDLIQLDLPFPSPEARERRFAYYHKDLATWVDQLAFTSSRPDQILSSLREFELTVDLTKAEDLEELRDAEEYIRRRAEIEPQANYRVSVLGGVIFVDGSGTGIPRLVKNKYTKPMYIKDIILRPADLSLESIDGPQRYAPFIDVVAFHDDGGNVELLVPCSSIALIHSMRYNGAP